MQDFVIKKLQVPVEISTLSGLKLSGVFFLPETSRYHVGRETIEEYMNSQESFVVFRMDEETIFFNKDAIKMIKVLKKEEEENLYPNISYREEECLIKFRDGEEINCKIRYEIDKFHNRIYDFLNHSENFFIGIYDSDFYLLNKKCIVEIKLREKK